MLAAVFSWNEFYVEPSSPIYILPRSRYTSCQTVSQGSQYVFACFFASCSASKGGGIFVSAKTKLLVEETSFSSCQATSGNGGGLFLSVEGSCVFSRVCSYSCKATSEGHFCYHYFQDSVLHSTKLKDCAVSYTNNPSVSSSFYLGYGLILVSSVNSSNNKCIYYSGIDVKPLGSDYTDCLVSYCCFMNNEDNGGNVCINFYSSGKAEMRSCNVIKNKQKGSYYGTITTVDSNLNIRDSCVIENIAPYSISQLRGKVYLYNTLFDKIDSGCSIESEAKSSFTNILLFIKTGECDAEYPKSFTKANIPTYMIPVNRKIGFSKLSIFILICACNCQHTF